MRSSTFIAPHQILFFILLLLTSIWASENSVSSGDKLQMSKDALCSMPYGYFRLGIYEHTNNHKSTTASSQKIYFYTPIALLDQKSAASKYNSITKLTRLRFRVEMWNENVQNDVVNYLSEFTGQQIRPVQVQPIPFEKVMLTSTNKEPTTYLLSAYWQPYQLEKFLWFSLTCIDQNDCNQLKDSMNQDPATEFADLKLLFSISSQTSETKEAALRFENIGSSQTLIKLLNRCQNTDYALITIKEENQLLKEMTNDIIRGSLDDSSEISPSFVSQVYQTLKGFLVKSTVKISKRKHTPKEPVCWDDTNHQTDETPIFGTIDEVPQNGDAWSEVNENTRGENIDYANLDIPPEVSFDEISAANLNQEDEVEGADDKEIVTKTISLSNINLSKLRDGQSIPDIHVTVRHPTPAHTLTTAVHFVQFSNLSINDEWLELTRKLKELQNDHENLKTDYQDLKTDYQNFKRKFQVPKKEVSDITFHAYRQDDFNNGGKYVPYQFIALNRGNGLDKTTGIFTAPKAGTYVFSFNSDMNFSENQYVEIRLNEIRQRRISKSSDRNGNSVYGTSAISIVLSLNVNDKVGVYLGGGVLNNSYFSGFLIREKQ